MSIINGLRASLDAETGGEIAVNLNDLYGYMTRRLGEAMTADNAEIVTEVINLLLETGVLSNDENDKLTFNSVIRQIDEDSKYVLSEEIRYNILRVAPQVLAEQLGT